MKIGLLMPFTEDTANPADFCRAAEALGFESMWVPEHPILPANPKTPFPQGGPIPPVYSHMGDQFVALSMAAADDQKIEARHRHLPGARAQPDDSGQADSAASTTSRAAASSTASAPAGCAKKPNCSAATFRIAGRRPPSTSPRCARCGPRAKRRSRKYVKLSGDPILSAPAQPAGPPVLLGSRDKNALKRVAKWGDGWCPIRITVDEMKQATAQLREECDKAGQRLWQARPHRDGFGGRRTRQGAGRTREVRGARRRPLRDRAGRRRARPGQVRAGTRAARQGVSLKLTT